MVYRYILSKFVGPYINVVVQKMESMDPMYVTHVDERTKAVRREKRPMPQGLTPTEEKVLKSVRRKGHYYDKCFAKGTIGWASIIGFVPLVGALIALYMGYQLIMQARKLKVPDTLITEMFMHLAIGAGIGFIPIAGDIFAAIYQPNARNALILDRYLSTRSFAGSSEFIHVAQSAASSLHK